MLSADVSPLVLFGDSLCSAWPTKRERSLALQVTNLTNKLYYISKVNTGAGYLDGPIGMPREWALTLHEQFQPSPPVELRRTIVVVLLLFASGTCTAGSRRLSSQSVSQHSLRLRAFR